jgi:cysteine synthase
MYTLEHWQDEPLPVITITDERVNLYAQYGVTMAAVAGCALSYRSLKLPAAWGLFEGLQEHGLLSRKNNWVENSSGRIAEMYLRTAQHHGLEPEQFTFIMKSDVPSSKRGIVRFHGAEMKDPGSKQDGILMARELGGGGWNGNGWGMGPNNTINPDQYACPYVSKYYETWMAAAILDAFGEFDDLIVPVGTGGTVVGLERGLRHRLGNKLTVVGAMCAPKEEIPGVRSFEKMKYIRQPWQDAVDERIEVTRIPSFLSAPWVSRAIRSNAGPSGGGTYVAACLYLENILKTQGKEALHGRKVVFVIHDEASQYVGDRLDEFPQEDFYPPTARTPRELIFGSNVK